MLFHLISSKIFWISGFKDFGENVGIWQLPLGRCQNGVLKGRTISWRPFASWSSAFDCNTVRAPRRPAKNFQRSRTAARLNQPPSFTLSEFVCEFVWLFTPFEFVFNFVCSIGYDYDCKVCSLPVSLDQYFFRFDVVFYWPLCWPPGARAAVAMVQVA